MRRTNHSRRVDAIDKLIERVYYQTCSGIPISVMDIPKVFAEGRRALAAGEDLTKAIPAFVETIKL